MHTGAAVLNASIRRPHCAGHPCDIWVHVFTHRHTALVNIKPFLSDRLVRSGTSYQTKCQTKVWKILTSDCDDVLFSRTKIISCEVCNQLNFCLTLILGNSTRKTSIHPTELLNLERNFVLHFLHILLLHKIHF